jgi:glyoxylase-like metal-dependent hydrolase (beta-lactamase superfamily II)/rhodanese-related sulfurtransferase
MYFQQFYLNCLAHASYMIGSEGEAAVVDPQRDVQVYLDEAEKNGLRITRILETHMHADFVSGHKELAARTGAKIYAGVKSGAKIPHVAMRDGEEVRFGKCLLRVLETPGHSIDSLCFTLYDLEKPEGQKIPWAVLTGDTLFIGDVGRPDLSPNHSPQELAGMLYDSLHKKLMTLPDTTLIYPAHGAGSLCGRVIGEGRHSTIGQERAFNYALKPQSKNEFVEMLTAEFADKPEYFLRDVEINRTGAVPLTDLPELPALDPEEVIRRQKGGAVVLDTRNAAEFGAGHVPGAMHIGLSGQYASWAGTLIGLDLSVILVAADAEKLYEARMRLARVGMENVAGFLGAGRGDSFAFGMLAWEHAGLPVGSVPQISVLDLSNEINARPGEIQVLDVRRATEWDTGHVAQAQNKPLHRLRSQIGDLDPQRPIAVHCKSGYRSSIASSLLLRAGFKNVFNVTGGFDAWAAQKLPVVLEESAAAGTTGCVAEQTKR